VAIDGISSVTGAQFIEGMAKYRAFLAANPFDCRRFSRPVKKKASVSNGSSRGSQGSQGSRNASRALLLGKTLLFTGFRDKALEALVEGSGGSLAKAMSKKVDILVIKENTKNKKTEFAEENGIQVMTGAELKQFIDATV
jgi:NAD-dependent DNA ligase